MKATTKLRQMLNSDEMVVAPFVLNALHAKIAESVGFQAVYMTGAGTAAERGLPGCWPTHHDRDGHQRKVHRQRSGHPGNLRF